GEDTWRRVDGWGHLLGDRGGGAWIGMRGLSRALAAHDGTDPAGAALLYAATARFGEPLQWPAQFYTQPDRAGVLASFAADVVELADDDRAARAILTRAAAHAAASLSAAAQGGVPPVLSAAVGSHVQNDSCTRFVPNSPGCGRTRSFDPLAEPRWMGHSNSLAGRPRARLRARHLTCG